MHVSPSILTSELCLVPGDDLPQAAVAIEVTSGSDDASFGCNIDTPASAFVVFEGLVSWTLVVGKMRMQFDIMRMHFQEISSQRSKAPLQKDRRSSTGAKLKAYH